MLTPQQQALAFLLSKQRGTQPTSGGLSPDTQDPAAQIGVGQMDAGTLQQLFGQQPQLTQQEGDKMHPMDAIQHIGSTLAPSASPAAPAPQASPTPQNSGGDLVRDKDGSLQRLLPPGIIGYRAKKGLEDSTNYLPVYEKLLGKDFVKPDNLMTLKDGSKFMDGKTFKELISAKSLLPSTNNPQLGREEAVTLKIITPEQADTLYKTPDQKIGLNELRLGVLASTADTRKGMLALGRNKLEQQQIDNLIKGISDSRQEASNPMGQQAVKLDAVIHARQLLSQAYNKDTGEYDLSKAASREVVSGVARAISPGGQLTDSQQEELSSPTAYGRMKAVVQFWVGHPVNANPQEITKMYRDMLDRQGAISQDLFNAHAARQLPMGVLLKNTNPLAYAAVLQNSFGTHDYRALVANSEDGGASTIPSPINAGGRGQQPPPAAPRPAPQQNPGLGVPHPRITIKAVRQLKP